MCKNKALSYLVLSASSPVPSPSPAPRVDRGSSLLIGSGANNMSHVRPSPKARHQMGCSRHLASTKDLRATASHSNLDLVERKTATAEFRESVKRIDAANQLRVSSTPTFAFTNTCIQCDSPHGMHGHPLRQCGRCEMVLYCSRSCQKQHWSSHRRTCDFTLEVKAVDPEMHAYMMAQWKEIRSCAPLRY